MIGKLIASILNIFRFHKFKIFFTLFMAVVSFFYIFPYDDLSEVVATKVAERTQNQVFLQFEHLGFQLFPYPALAVENVIVESSLFPAIQATRLSLAPSISGFLSFRPGFNAGIHNLWNGDVQVEMKTKKSSDEQGGTTHDLRLEFEKIDLSKTNDIVEVPLKLQGQLSSETLLTIDPTFATQPSGEMSMLFKELRFPSSAIPTQMGSVNIPGLSWNQIQIKGKLKGGKFEISQADLGSPNDLVNGNIRGDIEMRMDPRSGGGVNVNWGAYSLVVDLNISRKLDAELGPLLIFVDSYKTLGGNSARYRFKIAGQRFGLPPNISPASTQ